MYDEKKSGCKKFCPFDCKVWNFNLIFNNLIKIKKFK